jgi:hypothetical protein
MLIHKRILRVSDLIHAAVVQPPDVAQWLAKLRSDLE